MLKSICSQKTSRRRIWALAILFLINSMPLTAASSLNGDASAAVAYEMSSQGMITLIDIRRPSEWQQTGVGKGAYKISMHEGGFVEQVDALLGGDRTKPVALICAAGSRSSRTKAKLNALGFTNVTNIPEGMFGSGSGPGWLKRDLPLEKQ